MSDQQASLNDTFWLSTAINRRLQHIEDAEKNTIIGGLLIVLLIIGGNFWLMHRRVLIPIANLKFAADTFAAGKWTHPIDISGSDEIAELATHFNTMAMAQQRTLADINMKNEKLCLLNQDLESFSYSVSHDLRGPLRSMDGFALMLLEDYSNKLDHAGKDALTRIRASAQHMSRLITDLLRLSQISRAGISVKQIDLSVMAGIFTPKQRLITARLSFSL